MLSRKELWPQQFGAGCCSAAKYSPTPKQKYRFCVLNASLAQVQRLSRRVRVCPSRQHRPYFPRTISSESLGRGKPARF
jgi:hypothetical protein